MIKAIFFLITGAFLSSALITPFFMSFMQHFFPHVGWPFSRVFGRIAQIVAALIIIYFRKEFKLGMLAGYFKKGKILPDIYRFSYGLMLTTSSVILIVPILVNMGILDFVNTLPSDIDAKIFKIIFAAFVISVIEESFFRGLLFSGLKSRINIFSAAVCTSVIYALVHFIEPIKNFEYKVFNFTAGFSYMLKVFSRYFEPEIYPAIFGLFIVGMILCFVIHKSSSIYLCIGLHMGWAAGLKLIKVFTHLPGGTEIPNSLGGRYFLVAQPYAWLSMVCVFLFLLILTGRGSSFGNNTKQY